MVKTIYLEYDEEVLSVLQKIRKSGTDEIRLVIPKEARLFRNLTGLRLLRREAEKYQKTLSIATADERGRLLVTRSGLSLASSAMETKSDFETNSLPATGRKGAMGDIMLRPVKPLKTAQAKPLPQTPVSLPSKNRNSEIQPEKDLEALIGPKETSPKIKLPEPVKLPRLSYKFTVLPAVAVVLILAVLGFFVLPAASVTVVPRTEPITRDLEMQVDSSSPVADVQNLTIPGKRDTQEISMSQDYPATGVKNIGEKASGFVTLYNFSKNSLILRSSTTRLEAGGKIFYFLQDVGSIKPTARIGTDLQVDQSSLIDPVPIVAGGSGEDYNFPTGTRFEIYNEVFGHQAEVLYAINANPIAGGTNKEIKILSATDVEQARADLSLKIAGKMRMDLGQTATSEVKLLDNAYVLQVKEESLSKKINDETDSFTLSQKTLATALLFNEQDVRDLIVERIVRLLPENKYLLPEQQQKLTEQFVSLDISGGVGTLRAHFESQVRYQINADFLVRGLPGKTPTQVKEILLARPEISDVTVSLSPFWVKTVPRFNSKIHFKVQQ